MVAKRKLASNAPKSFKRRKEDQPEEISFDSAARQEYLTGFHKRKLQRVKHAQEQAAKREREEKAATRKAMRDDRKIEAEKHVAEVNAILKEQQGLLGDSQSEVEWEGIEEPEPMSYEDQYHDEDKLTTVTVEAVDISRGGMHARKESDGEEETDENDSKFTPAAGDSQKKAKRVWTKEKPSGPKKKKKKFRYESKAERKVTRMKEKAGNRAKAKSRKG